jgi:hypothetical protein
VGRVRDQQWDEQPGVAVRNQEHWAVLVMLAQRGGDVVDYARPKRRIGVGHVKQRRDDRLMATRAEPARDWRPRRRANRRAVDQHKHRLHRLILARRGCRANRLRCRRTVDRSVQVRHQHVASRSLAGHESAS